MRIQAATALLLLGGCFTESAPPKRAVARCADKTGDVRAHPAAEATWSPLEIGGELARGDWIQTAQDAWAELRFLAGGSLRVDPGSVVVLEDPEDDEGRPVNLVALQSGSVQGELDERGERRAVVVRTAAGKRVHIAPVSGSGELGYKVDATEGGDVRLAIKRGQATVRGSEGETVTLGRGQAQEVKGGRLVGEIIVLPAAPSPLSPPKREPARVEEGQPLHLAWRPERGAKRYRVQIAADERFREVLQDVVVEAEGFDFVPPRSGRFAWRVASQDAAEREGEFSPAEPLEVVRPRPDLLLEPKDGATVRFTQAAPLLQFRWRPKEGAASYRLVITRANGATVEEQTAQTGLKIRRLGPGEYSWGVYAGEEPLFERPRRLILIRGAGIELPKKLRWE